MFYCGIDIAKHTHCASVIDQLGKRLGSAVSFSNTKEGCKKVVALFEKHGIAKENLVVCMESSGKYWIPVFNVLEKTCWVTLSHPNYTKPQKGCKTDRKDAKWICNLFMCDMTRPSFIPPPDIREQRDLVRYYRKLTNTLTGEKNRARNCLTVSNLKLDDVFSDVFGKTSRSITEHILKHPGEPFDVTPFIHKNCKHPIEEIQAAVDGAISREQAAKLR